MAGKQKLELTWIGKENRPRLEPRILLENTDLSYHAAHQVTEHDLFDNRLISGDNLLALKALEQELIGASSASSSILPTTLVARLSNTTTALNIRSGSLSCTPGWSCSRVSSHPTGAFG